MRQKKIGPLVFPGLAYGTHQTPHDLTQLLYKGASALPINIAKQKIESGELGAPILDRLPLIQKLHDSISAEVAKKRARQTITHAIQSVRQMYAWCDATSVSINVESAVPAYKAWTESLLHRVRVAKDLKHKTAYKSAGHAGQALSLALDIKRGLRRQTRLRSNGHQKEVLGAEADKQNLADTFSFGHALLDITDALTVEAIRGSLPLNITFRTGQTLSEWSCLTPIENVKQARGIGATGHVNHALKLRAEWIADTSSRTRYPLINLRIEAELLVFLAQTGMNLEQAHKLKRGKFRFQTSGDDVLVYRAYKGRRGGNIEFRIYRAYRSLFERYLAWLNAMVPEGEDERLFPFIYRANKCPADGAPPRFSAVRLRCKRLGIPWVGPQKLRRTRVNWLLRRSRDPRLTAEQSQHSEETLLRNYEQPNHHLASREITRFHKMTDPSISPPGPGACVVDVHHSPALAEDAPEAAPQPDCVSPAGCLFCVFHRDIDSEDYVWSLATYRFLKTLEMTSYAPALRETQPHPAIAAIDRITLKLNRMAASSKVRALWVSEAIARVREGRYHVDWDGFIQCREIAA